jgi:hypothetical protein
VSIEFLVTSLIIVATPGARVLYTLAAGLSQGSRASIVAAFGCAQGGIGNGRRRQIGASGDRLRHPDRGDNPLSLRYYGGPRRACTCAAGAVARYQKR